MNPSFNHSIKTLISTRRSIRTYDGQPLDPTRKAFLESLLTRTDNPFGARVSFHLLEGTEDLDGRSLGTYGIITGAVGYIGALVEEGPLALEGLGYALENLILSLWDQGIGTCWMGGTFRRSQFERTFKIGRDQLFPAISPYGFPKEQRSLTDHLLRFASQGDKRKPWEELFFQGTPAHPLTQEMGSPLRTALEMVRLGPSASNKQPWRILLLDNLLHFYEAHTPGYGKAFPYDIQGLDLGIGACHLERTLSEEGIQGKWLVQEPVLQDLPLNWSYAFSYILPPLS